MRNELPEQVFDYGSRSSGPTAAIVGGVHGNEIAGIKVVGAIREKIDSGALRMRGGRLLLALGNPRAIGTGRRFTETDLNRCFSGEAISGKGDSYEHGRARKLAAALAGADLGIDVHGTNSPTEPFVVLQRFPQPSDRRVLRFLSANIVLCDPDMVFAGKRVTLDEYFSREGGVGLCYETGAADDDSCVSKVSGEIIRCLQDQGIMYGGARTPPEKPKETCVLREQVLLTEAGFDFADGVGERNFQPLEKGQKIGRHGARTLIAPYDCMIVFPKPLHLRVVGQPLAYLAARVRS